jgi:hypothetical protein
MNDERLGGRHHLRDRREILERVVLGILHYERNGGDRRRREEERVAVARGARRDLVTDEPRRARAIVDHELLPQRRGKMRSEQTRDRVRAPAGRGRHDDAHGLRGPFGLGAGPGRDDQQCAQQKPGESTHGSVSNLTV